MSTTQENVKDYFSKINNNLYDPFAIVQGYILGSILQSDDAELREIAKNFVAECGKTCDTGELIKSIISCGGNAQEIDLIRLADNLLCKV